MIKSLPISLHCFEAVARSDHKSAMLLGMLTPMAQPPLLAMLVCTVKCIV